MKITPSNQTLILASERRVPVTSGSSPGKTAVSNAFTFQRLTVVATQWDASVSYVMSSNRDSSVYLHQNGAAQYAQTQRIAEGQPERHIDVYA